MVNLTCNILNSSECFMKSIPNHPLPHSQLSLKVRIYTSLDRPNGWKCVLYHFIIFSLGLFSLIMTSMNKIFENYLNHYGLFIWESLLLTIYIAEFGVRTWAAGSQYRFRGIKGRLKYLQSFVNIIDCILIITTLLALIFSASQYNFLSSVLMFYRIIQILRFIRVDRSCFTWNLLSSTMYTHRKELKTALYIGSLLILLSATMIYAAENYARTSTKYLSMADALYWAIITVTTIGFGDIYPESWFGKSVCCTVSIIAVPIIALPASLIGSGLALKVNQKEREKKNNRKLPVAASYIATWWRYRCVSRPFSVNATWAKHAQDLDKYREYLTELSDKSLVDHNDESIQHSRNTTKYPNGYLCYTGLSKQNRTQLRVIYAIKYNIYRRKFQHLKQPFDIEDFLETYSRSNYQVKTKLKDMCKLLKHTLGSDPRKQVGPTSSFSGKSVLVRMDNVETKLDTIEKMLRYLIDPVHVNRHRDDPDFTKCCSKKVTFIGQEDDDVANVPSISSIDQSESQCRNRHSIITSLRK